MSKGWAGIARLGGIGDNLIAASVLRPLKTLGYNVEVITSPPAGTVFLHNPFIDKLSFKADGDITGDWQQWFVTRGREYDLFCNLSHTGEYRHALFKNTTAFWWREGYRRTLCAGSYIETTHDIVGVPHIFGPLFFSSEEETDRAKRTRDEQIGKGYVTWVVSGSRLDKVYPYAPAAICRIIKELNVPVMMVGAGPKQYELAKKVEDEVKRTNSALDGLHLALSPDDSDPGGAKNWSTRRSLSQVLLSDLVITPDTGIAWAAAFEPMPKVMLLSHASPDNITKHWVNTTTLHADANNVPCWPCHRLHDDISTCMPAKDCPVAAACMADISVEKIVESARNALNKRS